MRSRHVEPVQLPLPLALQLEPSGPAPVPLPWVSEGELDELHRGLSARLGRPIDLVATDNRSMLLSWRSVGGGLLEIRIQRVFALADSAVLDALARVILCRDPQARQRVQDFVGAWALPRRRRPRYRPPRGRVHDLTRHAREQEAWLDERFEGRIGWSLGRPGQRRRRIRLGSWSEGHRLVRVHPTLDRSTVPGFVVGFVVFHELLHSVVPPEGRGRLRMHHTEEFRLREAQHPDQRRAEGWIRENLEHLLAF